MCSEQCAVRYHVFGHKDDHRLRDVPEKPESEVGGPQICSSEEEKVGGWEQEQPEEQLEEPGPGGAGGGE